MQSQICEWKILPKNMKNRLHTICSYMAMFPPSLPHYFIEKYTKEGDVVFDPFSGRGTTVLEACLMNRKAVGNDKNILAYILTKTKCDVPSKGRIFSRIAQLEKKFKSTSINLNNENENIRMIFSDYTLKQLIYLKNNLKWRINTIDTFITAMVLGILHGNSMGYLSLSMPNTFSMSPNYIRNFIKKHELHRPNRDVFELLRRKLNRCYQQPEIKGKVYNQNATNMSYIKNESVHLVLTSPPYTRVIRYGQFNWIRLWFLGKTGKEIDEDLFFSQSLPKYCDFMSKVLNEIKRVLKLNGKAVLIIGDVKDRTSENIVNLADIVWKKCAEPLGFKLVEPIIEDIISDDSKVSRIWGDKKGRATQVERVLVLKKG